MAGLLAWLRRRRRPDADFAEEVAAHLALEAERLEAEGLAPAAAAAEARRRFGNVGLAREAFHRRRTVAAVEAFPQQLRRAGRRLGRAPVFAVTAVLTLALGIGATTAVFSLVDGVLLRPLPYPQAARLVDLSHTLEVHGLTRVDQSDATYLYYREASHAFSDVGAWRTVTVNLGRGEGGGPQAVRVPAARASASVFALLGVAPLLGRAFRDGEDLPGAPPVAILSERLWRGRYASDPRVVGRVVDVDGVDREVIGVMPAAFAFPDTRTALWLPVGIDPARTQTAAFIYRGIGRLRPDVTTAAAAADLQALLPRVPLAFPGRLTAAAIRATHMRPVVRPLRAVVVGGVGRELWVVFAAGAFLLLIACANVANLFLVRAEERQHDLAMRRVLGAGRAVIVAEFLAEALLLALLGGAAGVGLAVGGLAVLRSLASGLAIPRLGTVGLDGPVLALAAATTFAAAVLMSVVPAVRALHPDVAGALIRTGKTTAARDRHRARRGFVVVQMALALVLVAGAGLMVRTLRRLQAVPVGFDPAQAYAFRVALPERDYGTAGAVVGYVRQVLDGVAALPGVRAAGVMTRLPLDPEAREDTAVYVEGQPLAMSRLPDIRQVAWATPGAFAALGIPLIAGRAFPAPDPALAPLEVVVTRAFARRYWGDAPAVGRHLQFQPAGPIFTVVGETGDVRGDGLDHAPDQAVFLPLVVAPGAALPSGAADTTRWAPRDLALVVRASGKPGAIMAEVEQVLRTAAPDVPPFGARSMAEVVAASTARTSFALDLLEIAAMAALLIGAVGLYGVVSYMVSLRTREMAVRLALGAEPGALRRRVLTQAASVAALGIALGLAAALLLTRLLASLLFGVAPTDPVTLAGAAAAMAAVAAAASWIPARRAAAADPAEALRTEA